MLKRRKCSLELKRGTVQQARHSDISCAQVAREWGMGANLLIRWKREADAQGHRAFGGTGQPRDEEVACLKQALAKVTRERDFLHAAATYFARESS